MIRLGSQNPNNFIIKINIISKRGSIIYSTVYINRILSSNLIKLAESSRRKTAMVNEANDSSTTLMLTSGASGRVNALLSLRALRSVWLIIYSFVLLLLFPFRGSFYKSSAENGGGSAKEEKSSSQGGVVLRVPRKSSDAVDKEVAARRALSIKRVVEDNGCDETVRQFSLFVTSRGDTMFTQSWTPAKIKVRGLLVLMHGLNEHSGRYSNFAKQLNGYGIKVYAMDWIGHGGSDGLHAYVHSLDDAVTDMKMFLRKVFTENPRLPCFCFGHSTGGAIVLKAVLDPKVSECVSGVILTSPAVGVQPSHPIFALLAPVFSFLLPRFQFSAANKQGIAVSRDPEALRAKYSDPLVFTGSIRIRTGYEILRITSYLQKNLSRIRVPFFVLHGTADAVTDPKASEKLYDEASSSDKTIKLYEGCLHDLLFEPEREEIKDSIISWLNNRL
ncbi:monoglyceride lipase-like [Olea europaea subsp. europaea]|uniref:Monoglyceride lipase-like n=2 Tax=Olea europaea subsp. europaea TaxID=158383 RepID=A0A8S0S4A7_OLEEU|nr:monoglyceride lipase-like [Olea europaea subsp. europaea]